MRDVLLLLILSYAAFWFGLGKLGLIDPDEPFYALTAREMVQSGDWLTPRIFGAPQFEKPIFYYWLAAGSFRVFGESEFSGRLPTALSATLLALLTYAFGLRAFNRRTGLIAGLYMASGLELCLMGRLMLTDIPLAFFITASLFCYWLALHEPERRNRWIFWHMVCTGLAVLTKGPIGSMVPLLTTVSFTWITGQRWLLRGRGFWWGLLAYAALVLPWYGLMTAMYGWKFVDEFFVRDNWLRFIRAEHPANNHFWYYPGVLLLGSLPWLPGVALAVRRLLPQARASRNQLFLACWFLANLALLTAAASKLPSYGYFLFVPLALLIGSALDSLFSNGFQTKGEKRLLIGCALFQAAIGFAAPFINVAKAFAVPSLVFALFLVAGAAFLFLQRYRLWLAATVLASVALIGCSLTFDADQIEALSSIRPTARKMMALQQEGEPLLAGKFAVRGVYYYTRQPVSVIANNAHPFWADHPLPIIAGKRELTAFLKKHPSALCTFRRSEWDKFHNASAFAGREAMEKVGDNYLIRARRSK